MANLEDLIQEVDKSQLPEDITPEVGMGLVSKSADGNEMNLLIVEVKEATIVIDGNHPLAGKELTFDLEGRYSRVKAIYFIYKRDGICVFQ
jgi:FKBP-type peptidyl-prolyl cis-trans isomerase SlpA